MFVDCDAAASATAKTNSSIANAGNVSSSADFLENRAVAPSPSLRDGGGAQTNEGTATISGHAKKSGLLQFVDVPKTMAVEIPLPLRSVFANIENSLFDLCADAGLSAGTADIAEFFGSAEEPKAYHLFEGHRSPSQVAVW